MAEAGALRPWATRKPTGSDAGTGSALRINDLPDRGRVDCRGVVESVTYPPSSGLAAFTAIVSDAESFRKPDRKRLQVIWLGRRRIPGVVAGADIRFEGMLTHSQGKPTIFNPRYEILSLQERE
ncbi:hypothetical protein V1639_11095 [Pseudarthrobacter sp. J75]|uniref:hypothetical protein n=1 Tax=unclassified Pseudarthrobacter TaxID=2647000 RepID=UPI002E803FBE|nr:MULTISPECIES: hypothetical protein [unclassified Pseudarthrobacter]MEE2522702.1 hypothetical protein [Pseudarthrobacter sp. J47]MEE2529563.1 hypothetical protein [Pseudarthrobacter sp. J75]MEE2569669.1 hypothetical protein [Pseudarthrobacter sp. J64]